MELTLFYFSIEARFTELFKHFFDIPAVHEHIVRVDKYIIKIDHNTNI